MTEMLLVGYIIFASYKLGYEIKHRIVIIDLIKVLLATLIMSSFLWYFKTLNLLLLIVIGTLLYFISLYSFKGIDEEDINLLKKIISK
jgi:hypothetical protein